MSKAVWDMLKAGMEVTNYVYFSYCNEVIFLYIIIQ